MHATVLAENIQKALSIVGRTVSTRSELPILENILLEAKESVLSLATTNLESGITTNIGAKVEKKGAITVSVRLLTEFISTISAEKIEFTLEDTTLVIKGGKSRATLATIGAAEFPTFPAVDKEGFTLPQKDIESIASQVAFAASTDESRPVLTGLLFKPLDEKLLIAATDGFRLSTKQFSSSFGVKGQTIIPARTIVDVAKIAHDYSVETVKTSFAKGGNQLIFSLSDTQFFSRLIDGEFPNFERIIPTSKTTEVKLSRQDFQQAIKAASIFAKESANIVRLSITSDSVAIAANSPQVGDEKSEVEAKVEGESNEIAFNFRFLLDFLGSINDEELVFQMTTPLAPSLFQSVKDHTYSHIIMPVRVQS